MIESNLNQATQIATSFDGAAKTNAQTSHPGNNHVLVYNPDKAQAHGIEAILRFLGHEVTQQSDLQRIKAHLCEHQELLTIVIHAQNDIKDQKELTGIIEGNVPHILPIVLVHDGDTTADTLTYPAEWERIKCPDQYDQFSSALQRAIIYRDSNHMISASFSNILSRRLIGTSPAMQMIRRAIELVAQSSANVLILGESGTGKEVVAQNIHNHSTRQNNPFVPVNCGAIPPDLLESELFGHEKGAFTGAITTRKGRFEMAEGGTLFLDEIGEMTMAMQVKLLRVLEERVFERVGGTKTMHADVRIVAATNRNLEEMVQQGKFREDLYFRLDVFPINLPPLRERIEDLPMLARELISRLEHQQRGSVRLAPDALAAMSQYPWPGNVRELANMIERLAIQHPCGLVHAKNLPKKLWSGAQNNVIESTSDQVPDFTQPLDISALMSAPSMLPLPSNGFNLKSYVAEVEVNLIHQALDDSDGVVAHAAKLLGLQRTTLAEKMRKYDLNRPHQTQGGRPISVSAA